MAKVLNAKLNTTSINKLIFQLENYKHDLVQKCQEYVDALAEVGIETARYNLFNLVDGTFRASPSDSAGGGYGEMISVADKVSFSKEVEVSDIGAICIIIPASETFLSVWDSGSAVVDPLLMAEFGSGMFAVDGHRGTFPKQKYAFNPQGWFWRKDGVTYHSYGIEPSRPIYKAYEEMKSQMQAVAIQVFGA